ncbi:MAG: CO dehydrogenase/CO-methylating acetyl-CoA synthase complex subunit beta [Candidatus Omnitrophica bacterium]|nr:CO dehydrogenase/CO-methylating acetyl-CoA synthase complex subunit beta [Candidatus Omnitrophota bacterium]
MSKIVAQAAISGARKLALEAEQFLNKAIKEKGNDQKVEFPETAFYLPMANALLGAEVKTVGEIIPIMDHIKELLHDIPTETLWLPYLGDTLDSGIAALLSEEIICVLRYLYGQEPQPDCNGFFTDTILRTLGIQLVDGRMPGFAAILGAAPNTETAVYIVRELQKRNILTFVGSSTGGKSVIDQLKEGGVQMGWDNYIVPYGRDTITGIYPLNWAIRGALTFGGIKAGQARKCLEYCKERVFAFGLALGEIDDIKYATGAGAIDMGFPVIADTDIPEIRPTGICTYEHLVKEKDYKKIVPVCIEVRGVKVKLEKIDIPVPYAAAFEGERVRREEMYVQFGGKFSKAFEFLTSRDLDNIEDETVKIIGPDVDGMEEGKSYPLGIIIEVAGRKMHVDFESILERQIHRFLNYAMGVFHMGQRDMNWIRISKNSAKAGFKLKHFGNILVAKFHSEYGAIIDKVAVTIYTKQEDIDKVLPGAQKVFAERDERLLSMKDEDVDTFYSCTLCQSFAPDHLCIMSPERLGLCGALSWFDGKVAYEITPTGGNQPVKKGKVVDEAKGIWEGVNEAAQKYSHGKITGISVYSLMESPMTSCGCFECIVAIVPEANGIMVVNREYAGMTPAGMKFTTLAGSVGGGGQTPGFLGVGRLYIISKKFISADGGLKRVVWMPKELKEALAERLKKRSEEIGDPDFINKIADETTATEAGELVKFLEKAGHPALSMPPLM